MRENWFRSSTLCGCQGWPRLVAQKRPRNSVGHRHLMASIGHRRQVSLHVRSAFRKLRLDAALAETTPTASRKCRPAVSTSAAEWRMDASQISGLLLARGGRALGQQAAQPLSATGLALCPSSTADRARFREITTRQAVKPRHMP